jgi:hypothetical protein
MRDQISKTQNPTQLRIEYDHAITLKPHADRAFAHIMRHRPATVDALRRLFKPHWRVNKLDLIINISNSRRWKAAGVTVSGKGELQFPSNSFLETTAPNAPVGYEAFDGVGDRAPPRKRIAPPAPRPAPPPPEPEPELLEPPPAWLEDGDAPSLSHEQLMRRRRQNSEVAILETIRGCKLDIDRNRLYTGDVLSAELDVSEDEYRLVASQPWGRKKAEFPRSFRPTGKTPKELARLRQKFHRDQAKQGEKKMLNQETLISARTRPRITSTEALLNALPAPPGRATVAELAIKLRPHSAFRTGSGRMVKLKSVERRIRNLIDHPEIGCERPPNPDRNFAVGLFWRKPSGPRG